MKRTASISNSHLQFFFFSYIKMAALVYKICKCIHALVVTKKFQLLRTTERLKELVRVNIRLWWSIYFESVQYTKWRGVASFDKLLWRRKTVITVQVHQIVLGGRLVMVRETTGHGQRKYLSRVHLSFRHRKAGRTWVVEVICSATKRRNYKSMTLFRLVPSVQHIAEPIWSPGKSQKAEFVKNDLDQTVTSLK